MLLKKLGKYEIIEWLGGGRFGDVFLARDTIIDKEFALKISRMRREEVAMLKQEARLLASLSHPNIVRFYNIDFIENKFALVMEYVKGNDLRDIIIEGGIGVEHALKIMQQVIDALVYAHRNNVLHRDLKPENILITGEHDAGRVKITDFGLAKFIRSGSISASSAGTPIYMAPEAWSGNFSDRSDVWSLGTIFYELLTGVPPFLDDSLDGLRRKIEKTVFLAPTVLRHDIPQQVEEIVLRSLVSDPDSRPSAEEIRDQMKIRDHAMRATNRARLPSSKADALSLTPVQEEALAALEDPVLLIGQAGCGKTTTLTHAVGKLLDGGIPASRILVCTFTNKAANDIRERLQKGDRFTLHDLWLGTFHTLGFRILRRDAERLDMSADFMIRGIKDIFKEIGVKAGEHRSNAMIRFIETLKARGITPDDFKPQNAWEKSCHDAYQQYQTYAKKNNLMDYDDLILYSIKLLQENSDICQYYQNLFEYIFVDELQDINPAQYKLISLIYKKRIFFTGDEDQAIYGWRGAERELILRVPRDYPETKIFNLNKSFRLAQGIIEIANNLMMRKATIIPAPHTSDVFVYAAKSEHDEADYVAREITNLVKEGVRYQDIAVLCRMNYLARTYEQALARTRIPHALIAGVSFYERIDVKPIVDYLALLEQSARREINPASVVGRALELLKIPNQDRERAIKIFQYHLANLRLLTPHKVIQDLIDLTSIKGASIDELQAMASSHQDHDFTEFLNEIRLYQELDLVDWNKDLVKLMTVHSAKGLQFPIVFIVDLVEDVFPLTKKMASGKEIEEERRLCYVALTRAQKKLYLLYAKWQHGRYQHPSRFLVDMLKKDF